MSKNKNSQKGSVESKEFEILKIILDDHQILNLKKNPFELSFYEINSLKTFIVQEDIMPGDRIYLEKNHILKSMDTELFKKNIHQKQNDLFSRKKKEK